MKLLITLLIIGGILFAGYRYFALDTNKQVGQSIKDKDYQAAESAIQIAISDQLQDKARRYLHDHNNYFVSTSNNLCTSAKSLFSGLEKITTNPVECVAQAHSFTARIKRVGLDSYYCADASGFATIAVTEEGYRPGVKCK